MVTEEDPPDGGGKYKERMMNEQRKEEFKYTTADTAPYRLYFELRKEQAGVRINRYSLGAKLRGMEMFKRHIIDMKQIGRNKIMVIINSFVKANQLLDVVNNEDGMYRAYIPKHLVCISGVITGIPTDISEEEIMNDIESDVPVVGVYRLNRFENGTKVPTNRISVTFRASCLPDKVWLFCCVSKIKPFIQKVVFCMRCLRYNHKEANCKGARRCQRCSEKHDDEDEEEEVCHKRMKCLHCKSGNHATGSKECNEHKIQQKVKDMMARKNVTYIEAREMLPINTSNMFEPLSSLDDFPSLAESLSTNNNLKEQWQQTNLPRQKITPAVKMYPEKKKNNQPNKRKRAAPEPETEQSLYTAGPSGKGKRTQQMGLD